jgi:hypothetical protein
MKNLKSQISNLKWLLLLACVAARADDGAMDWLIGQNILSGSPPIYVNADSLTGTLANGVAVPVADLTGTIASNSLPADLKALTLNDGSGLTNINLAANQTGPISTNLLPAYLWTENYYSTVAAPTLTTNQGGMAGGIITNHGYYGIRFWTYFTNATAATNLEPLLTFNFSAAMPDTNYDVDVTTETSSGVTSASGYWGGGWCYTKTTTSCTICAVRGVYPSTGIFYTNTISFDPR